MSVVAWLFVFRFLVPLFGGMLAMVTDIRERRIPNWLSVSICISGLVFRTTTGGGSGFLDSLAGFAVGFAVLFVLYAIGGGGAGDVKFMAAVGTWIGPYHILFVFVLSAIVLVFYTFLVLVWRLCQGKKVSEPVDSTNSESGKKGLKSSPLLRTRLPYAVPATIAIGIRLAWLLLIGRTA